MKYTAGILTVVFLLCLSAGPSSACNVCHSKNPKMVRMHQALGYKDCFSCHARGLKSSPEEKKVQQQTDARCVRCHALMTPEGNQRKQ